MIMYFEIESHLLLHPARNSSGSIPAALASSSNLPCFGFYCRPSGFTTPVSPLSTRCFRRARFCVNTLPSTGTLASILWTRWYQLRGLPLVGSECICQQCNSSFASSFTEKCHAIGHGLYRPSLKNHWKRKQGKCNSCHSYPTTVLCTVKCSIIRPQPYKLTTPKNIH